MITSKSNGRKIIIMLIFTILLALFFMFVGFLNKKTEKYYFTESNDVDYKVYLKDNSFFDTEYLDKNKVYITSLIKYISSTFKYNVTFNKPVSGEINYKLMAEIIADQENSDGGNFWTKEYVLQDIKTDNIVKSTSYNKSLTQDIDYSQYNELLEKFISEYGLSAESTLKIYLKVDGKVKVDNTDNELNVNSSVSLDMPLSKLAIEGTINTDNQVKENKVEITSTKNELICYVFRILFAIDLIYIFRYIYQYIQYCRLRKKKVSYRRKILNIKNEYEGIITNVTTVDLNKFSTIEVKEFDDLLNVYNTTREPINCWIGSEKTIYFIINGNSCYAYIINKKDYDR